MKSSAVLRHARRRWRGVAVEGYADRASGGRAAAVAKHVLAAGSRGAPLRFDVRYFALGPGARTNHERHRHAHVIVVLHGRGRIRLGGRWRILRPFDACYVAPDAPHALDNPGRGHFGFLCVVDARRDRGVPVS